MTNTNQIQNLADALARRTRDAYSFDRYGFASWRRCCGILLARGYSEERAEMILRSVLMRLAADDAKQCYHATSADMVRLLDKPGTADWLDELFDECETPAPVPSRQALRLVWSR